MIQFYMELITRCYPNVCDTINDLYFQEKLERMNSGNNLDSSSPRKVLIEQLHRVLPSDDSLPEQVHYLQSVWKNTFICLRIISGTSC